MRKVFGTVNDQAPLLHAPYEEIPSPTWSDVAYEFSEALAAGANARMAAISYGYSIEYSEHVAETIAEMAMNESILCRMAELGEMLN